MQKSFLIATIMLGLSNSVAISADFPYHRSVSLKVGQSIVLKGVRSRDCSDRVPDWAWIAFRMPKSVTGRFSDGGPGTVKSNYCQKRVGGRGVKFTATRPGREAIILFKDPVKITVTR